MRGVVDYMAHPPKALFQISFNSLSSCQSSNKATAFVKSKGAIYGKIKKQLRTYLCFAGESLIYLNG